MSDIEGGFRTQLEAALGRPVAIVWESELQARLGIHDRAEFRRLVDRYSDVVPIEDVLAGRAKLGQAVTLVASLQRGGILIQLREVPTAKP